MERAEGADEGPGRSQARTKQRNQAKGAMMIGLSTTRTSIYGGHMMWLCNGWRRGPEARYSNGILYGIVGALGMIRNRERERRVRKMGGEKKPEYGPASLM